MVAIVIGGGLSGLATAYRLVRLGLDPIVLEARGRVGGRAWRVPLGADGVFDVGCEVLDEGHSAVLRLLEEVGVGYFAGAPWAAEGTPPLEGDDLALYRALGDELEALAARVDSLHPEQTEGAARLDLQTLGGWLVERRASDRVLAAAETRYSVASASVPIAQMSLLAFAAKLAAGAARHGLRLRVEGGPAALAERLAAKLGDCVRLGSAVLAVEQDGHGVRVRLGGGEVVRGDGAVVAVPLTLQRELRFDPPLPAPRRLALERCRYGDAVKAGLSFGEAFWDSEALPVVTDRGVVYEPEPGRPVLGVFAGSAAAAPTGREPLRTLELGLGSGVPSPQAVVAVDWTKECFSRGSYLILGPGDLTTWGARLADPHGRLHFAGSEASPLPSYVEGAILAAERAAREIAAAA